MPLGGAMPYDVVVGPFNPVAPPVVLDFEPPKALGRAVFDVAYEGAPGCVHGAVLAATFDIVLTAANAIEGSVGPTVSLAFRYLRPTLTDEEAVFEGWVTEVTDRRIFSKGRIVQDGIVTVEADGEFAIFNQDGVNRMASSRQRTFDAGQPRRGPGSVDEAGGPGRAVGGDPWSRPASREGAPVAAAVEGPGRLRLHAPAADTLRRDRRHGVVHHAAYLPYLEEARVEYLRSIGHPTTRCGRSAGVDVAVLEVAVQYRSPCTSTTRSTWPLRVGAVKRTTFQIAYLLWWAARHVRRR